MTHLLRRSFDPGLFVALLVAIVAAWPLLTRPGLPLTDVESHVFRTFELIRSWQAGVWFPRWAPDLAYGFGYPVFHDYAPLAYYLGPAYSVPAGASVQVLEHSPLQDRLTVVAADSFVLRLLTFCWPGWTAYLDGAPVPIDVSAPEGWIGVRVPAGSHTVLARLEETWPRQLGWAITGLAAVGLLGMALRPSFFSSLTLTRERPDDRLPLLVVGGLVLAALAARYWLDQDHWWLRPWTGPLPGQFQQAVALEANIDFLGYDLPQARARPGDSVPLTLYWKARAAVPLRLRVFVHLIGPDGQLYGQSDKLRPGGTGEWGTGLMTDRWPTDRYVEDPHTLAIRPDAVPGQYRLVAGLWDDVTGARMHVLDSDGAPTAEDGIELSTPFRLEQP